MKNGDKIRMMSDPELAEFMRQCEREEIKYYQHDCKECIGKACDDCRIRWLDTDPDMFKEDPDTFETILKTVDILFPRDTMYQRATLAKEVYKRLRND